MKMNKFKEGNYGYVQDVETEGIPSNTDYSDSPLTHIYQSLSWVILVESGRLLRTKNLAEQAERLARENSIP